MNLTEAKLKSDDPTWAPIGDQEREVLIQLDSQINNLTGAVNLAKKILALKGNAGWLEFVKAVGDLRVYRRQELELSSSTDADLRILQGRCRELGAILSLMTETEANTEVLAGRLKGLVAERALRLTEVGKIKPQGDHSS